MLYDRIVDEVVFVSRASEGAVGVDWLMNQPISTRLKYKKDFDEELKERQKRLDKIKK